MNQKQIVVSNNLELYEQLLLNGIKQTTLLLLITFIITYAYLQDSSGSRPNLLETTYGDDLYVDTGHSEPYDTVTQTTPTRGDAVTTTEVPTTAAEVPTVPECTVTATGSNG